MLNADEVLLRQKLGHLQAVLAERGESAWADRLSGVLAGSDVQLHEFLASNSLWGGSGSLADMAGMEQGRPTRRAIEAALIDLGHAQIEAGLVNQRTEWWVGAFRTWRDRGI